MLFMIVSIEYHEDSELTLMIKLKIYISEYS